MTTYRHLELLSSGSVSRMRLLDQWSLFSEDLTALSAEWNAVADDAECQLLFLDLSSLQRLSSGLLCRLLKLQQRLQQKQGTLILCGLRSETREVLSWTKLDRLLQIQEESRPAFSTP